MKWIYVIVVLIACSVVSCESSSDVSVKIYAVGDAAHGGIVVYTSSDGMHGLVMPRPEFLPYFRANFWPEPAAFGFSQSELPTGTTIGSGAANTQLLVRLSSNNPYVAGVCDTLRVGGLTDWYLPSQDELFEIYRNREKLPGMASEIYVSSSLTAMDPAVFNEGVDFSTGEKTKIWLYRHDFIGFMKQDRAFIPVRSF